MKMSKKKQRQIHRKKKGKKMEVSKVTFTKETKLKLQNPMLGMKKRSELKKELVKEYIRNKPTGSPIPPKDLIMAATYDPTKDNEYNNGYAFIKGMVSRGEITKESIVHSDKSIWTVPNDSRTIIPPMPKLSDDNLSRSPVVDTSTIDGISEDVQFLLFTDKVEDAAKTFVWKTRSFDVKEFVKWLKLNERKE